MLPNELMN